MLDRVWTYYESTGSRMIIGSRSGEEIIDSFFFNKYAAPSARFSGGWLFTHGVGLSAFDYIDEVTGDKAFFANNIKFYNYVVEHMPYFRENEDC